MEILSYVYFGINLMMLGSYILDSFNNDSKITKIFTSVLLFFFGGILVVYEFTIADKVAEWWYSSQIGFLWKLYIIRDYDRLSSSQVEQLEKQLSQQEDKNSRFYKNLELILKRHR